MRKAIISEAQDLYILRAQSFQHFCKLAYSPEELETIIHAYTPTEIALAVSSGNIFVL